MLGCTADECGADDWLEHLGSGRHAGDRVAVQFGQRSLEALERRLLLNWIRDRVDLRETAYHRRHYSADLGSSLSDGLALEEHVAASGGGLLVRERRPWPHLRFQI